MNLNIMDLNFKMESTGTKYIIVLAIISGFTLLLWYAVSTIKCFHRRVNSTVNTGIFWVRIFSVVCLNTEKRKIKLRSINFILKNYFINGFDDLTIRRQIDPRRRRRSTLIARCRSTLIVDESLQIHLTKLVYSRSINRFQLNLVSTTMTHRLLNLHESTIF